MLVAKSTTRHAHSDETCIVGRGIGDWRLSCAMKLNLLSGFPFRDAIVVRAQLLFLLVHERFLLHLHVFYF